MVDIEKRCNNCIHAGHFGLHDVKIKCDVDGKEMFGYTGKDEYRVNAKNCKDWKIDQLHTNWGGDYTNDGKLEFVRMEDINWI